MEPSCLDEMLSSFLNCFLFDKLWWKDYGIPLIGTVGIPLVVWILTRYYGADKAEERKELRQLRDNLNLILSISLDAISKLIAVKKTWLTLNEIEKKYETNLWTMSLDQISKHDWTVISQIYMLPMELDMVNIANYSPCIAISENYVIHLIQLISACKILVFKIEIRNSDLHKISECTDIELKQSLIRERINIDIYEFKNFIENLDCNIIALKYFIEETKNFENKYNGMKLDNIIYTEEIKKYFREIENNLKSKETSND